MTDITRLARFISGMPRDVDITTNSLQVFSLKVGTASPSELTQAMVNLLNTINTTGIPAANMSAGAKQSVLESKMAAMRVGVLNFVPTTGQTSDTVTTPVLAASMTDTPVGAGAGVGSVNALGIFVGTVSSAADIGKVLIRVHGTDNGIDDGTGDEIYGVLSELTGVYTLSYMTAAGSAYTIQASDTSVKMDFYFIEVMNLYSFGVDRFLMPAISGVIDATTASAVFGESSARMTADSSLQANINAEITARTDGDNLEITARSNADLTLQANIDVEKTARIDSDSGLQTNLNSEITARSNADSSLQANINSEATARMNGDSTLQANLNSEITSRLNGDSTLQANLNSEITARKNGDSTLQANLNSEITSRTNADTTLQANIDSEASSRIDMDSSLQANINSEASSRLLADSSLQANINSEATARMNGDSTLQANLNSEITSRLNGDSTLQANLNSEITSRLNGDSTLQANLNSEITSRTNADTTLQANIDSETSSRLLADSTLQANIDSEASSRLLSDSTLQANINSEASSRLTADSTLTTNLNSEITARMNADSTLQSQISAINVTVVDVGYTAATGGITQGDVVILSTTTAGEVMKANATAISTCESVLGVATQTKTAGNTVMIRAFGNVQVTTDGTNFDLGKRVYVATTDGQATKTAPATVGNVVYLVGGATGINKVFVNTNLEYVVM